MYNQHFGFRESPFNAAPSGQFFYTNELYREALANLRYGIEWRKGLIVMTGEVGTGKTTVLGKILRSLEATMHPIVVSSDHLTYFELLRFISKELGLPVDGRDRLAIVEQLRQDLVARHKKGHRVALLIDEAQSLSDEIFESIRFLSNLETEEGKLLQIVLAGQPELEKRLDDLSLRHLKQRIVIHCRLAPLKENEVGRYIEGSLQQAGYTGKNLFAANTIREVASYSEGIPRLINIICDNALLLAYAQSKHEVTPEMIQEVGRDLGLKQQPTDSPTAVANTVASVEDTNDRCVPDPVELKTPAKTRQKHLSIGIPGGVSLALVAISGVGGVLYSWQMRERLNVTPASERQSSTAQEPIGKLGQSSSAVEPVTEITRWQDVNAVPVSPKAAKEKSTDQKPAAKQQESFLGNFEIVEPFSFLRSTPRPNAKIIATLQPGTEIEVLNRKGHYFRVRANVDGRMIRGYIHREDAFFGPVRKDG